jgi:hypothetical protein
LTLHASGPGAGWGDRDGSLRSRGAVHSFVVRVCAGLAQQSTETGRKSVKWADPADGGSVRRFASDGRQAGFFSFIQFLRQDKT